MHVDASVLVAVLKNEPERSEFLARIQTETCSTSVVSMVEAAIALSGITGSCASAMNEVLSFSRMAELEIRPIEPGVLMEIALTWDRYGKGSGSPAKLNLGDCISYAVAKEGGEQLLYKGEDFSKTDIG